VYIDDIVVKTRSEANFISDHEETFTNLRRHNIMHNLEKCVFGIPSGIEVNPEKVTAIQELGPITNVKGVQHLMGCLAALSRFVSRLGERSLLKRPDPQISAKHNV
jgi:hypothetical protein